MQKTPLAFLSILSFAALHAFAATAAEQEIGVPCEEMNEPTALSYSDHTLGCVIDPAVDLDFVQFMGDSGDFVRIQLSATANNMDPVLELRDPVGTLLAVATCSDRCSILLEPPNFSEAPMAALALTGTYTILVSDQGANETGSYDLQIERIPPPSDPTPLAFDEPLDDAIAPPTDTDFFSFEGLAGSDLRLVLFATADNADPRIEVWDPTGQRIADETCADRCTEQVDLIDLAVTGRYLVGISEQGINENGSYRIGLSCLFGPCDVDDPAALASYSSHRSGTLSPAGSMDFFVLNGTPGTSARLSLSATGDNMDAFVQVRDPVGVVIAESSCVDRCSILLPFEITMAGPHRISVQDAGNNEAGSYELAVHCLRGTCDTDADGLPDQTRHRLLYGKTLSPSIEARPDADLLDFQGEAGTQIRINVSSTASNMDPFLEIYDPDGDLLHMGGCNDLCSIELETGDFSESPSATLAKTGRYRIAVRELGANETGAYSIELNCLFPPNGCDDIGQFVGPLDNCADVENLDQLDLDSGTDDDALRPGDQSYGRACDVDLNDDGTVGPSDFFGPFRPCIGMTVAADPGCLESDLDGDGLVGPSDFFGHLRPAIGSQPGPGLSDTPR